MKAIFYFFFPNYVVLLIYVFARSNPSYESGPLLGGWVLEPRRWVGVGGDVDVEGLEERVSALVLDCTRIPIKVVIKALDRELVSFKLVKQDSSMTAISSNEAFGGEGQWHGKVSRKSIIVVEKASLADPGTAVPYIDVRHQPTLFELGLSPGTRTKGLGDVVVFLHARVVLDKRREVVLVLNGEFSRSKSLGIHLALKTNEIVAFALFGLVAELVKATFFRTVFLILFERSTHRNEAVTLAKEANAP